MADGLDFDNTDYDYLTDCPECENPQICCDMSCEAVLWIAPCGSIDWETGIPIAARFCEPIPYKLSNFSRNRTTIEKSYQGCKTFRLKGPPDPSFDVTFDICQSSYAHSLLVEDCPFNYIYVPKANNFNLELNPSLFNQKTKVWWGRVIGDTDSWELPDKDCQTMSRTYLTDGYCYQTLTEAGIANLAEQNRLSDLQTEAA